MLPLKPTEPQHPTWLFPSFNIVQRQKEEHYTSMATFFSFLAASTAGHDGSARSKAHLGGVRFAS